MCSVCVYTLCDIVVGIEVFGDLVMTFLYFMCWMLLLYACTLSVWSIYVCMCVLYAWYVQPCALFCVRFVRCVVVRGDLVVSVCFACALCLLCTLCVGFMCVCVCMCCVCGSVHAVSFVSV